MACPACKSRLRQIPCVYPTWWCGTCGTLLHGSEEELETSVPIVMQRAIDEHGRCLRDDRAECVVLLAARNAAQLRTKDADLSG
jgi:hypothetical protein